MMTTTRQAQDFETLLKPLEKRVYNYLKKLCQEGHLAQDILQETFLSAYEKRHTLREPSKFASWLYQIATNHCRMYKRGQKFAHDDSESILLQTPDSSDGPPELFDQKDFATRLEHALSQLPEKYRVVLILKDIEGFTAKEISEKLGLTLPNIKMMVLRARQKLQVVLEE